MRKALMVLSVVVFAVVNYGYYDLNVQQRVLVERYGCGCNDGFTANTMTAVVLAVTTAATMVMMWTSMRAVAERRYSFMTVSMLLAITIDLRIYRYSSWL